MEEHFYQLLCTVIKVLLKPRNSKVGEKPPKEDLRPAPGGPPRTIRLFVYGTLKRGCSNHDAFCRGVLSIEPAAVRGRLYELASGFPVLAVPVEDILAFGTDDPLADTATQARAAERRSADRPESGAVAVSPYADWTFIHGELLTFDDPEGRLPALDGLEEFDPHKPTVYRRALLFVQPASGPTVPAWIYVLGTRGEDLEVVLDDSWNCR